MVKPDRSVHALILAVLFGAAAAAPGASFAADARALAREERLVLPTYVMGPAEANPIFYSGRAYQGAKGPVYPYALLDRLSDRKEDKAYRAVYLENEYVRICVLPEIGGRIFEAVDKTNGYDFVYRQHVIKPALIGMLGAWISGGVEWNIPHHHRATTFMPVDCVLDNAADGSATVWVGETELRHRTRWVVGLTLRPGSSALEVTVRFFNRTPFAQSLLCFANVAVHANESYQVLFPPSTEVATFHGKNQFSAWPVSHEVFNGQDYTKGVDVSWWKNHLTPTSFFAFDAEEDFLGGYDHGKKAGVAFIGDHDVVPGKKLWTWGTGSEGKTWERILTDADGPYLELMIGSYSDNQPDYSWTQPYETKEVRQFWYPLRALGGLKNANREAACNLEMDGSSVRIAFNTTSDLKAARGVLAAGDKVVFQDTFDVGPARPYERVINLPEAFDRKDLGLALFAADGRELVRFVPRPRKNGPLPAPVTPPPPPKDIKTAEELYLAGLRLEQFHNPAVEPYPYYEEALRRDPGDVRSNTALGILYLKRGMCREAEERLRTALTRLTFNYTRPKDGEASYYLGLALRGQGRGREAEKAFARAAWSAAWTGPSSFQLAELASASGDYPSALDRVVKALDLNRLNIKALGLEAALLRRLGRTKDAIAAADGLLRLDPLNAQALQERSLAALFGTPPPGSEAGLGAAGELLRRLADGSVPNTLELAMDYVGAGLWKEAAAVLEPAADGGPRTGSPLPAYAMAWVLDRMGQAADTRKFLKDAAWRSPLRVFPFELEFVDIFEWAMKKDPFDARAPYYLGNLLFDLQPERAIAAWERSRSIDPSLPTVHRNLGLAYARVKDDPDSAAASLEKAVAADPKDGRLYHELDAVYEAAGIAPAKRLAVLEKNHAVVSSRDDALAREIGLLVQTGRFDRALDLLKSHHFHVWEGGGEIHGLWVEANLLRGRERLRSGKFIEALADFQAALTYPANLEVAAPSRGAGSARASYLSGRALELSGKTAESVTSFEKGAALPAGWTEEAYFKGLALARLGRTTEAAELFKGLVDFSESRIRSAPAMDFFEKFGERRSARTERAQFHFLAGLGLSGLGRGPEADEAFAKARELDPNLWDLKRRLVEASPKVPPAGGRPYLAAAEKAAAWVRAAAVETPQGLDWPADPKDPKSVNASLYAGAPGVVLFFLEGYHVTHDPRYLRDARAGADGLIAAAPGETGTGLYEGLSGVLLALEETFKASGDAKYRKAFLAGLERIAAAAVEKGQGLEWGSVTDIISGGAGTGLFLIYAYHETKDRAWLDLASRAGTRLVELGRPENGGLKWAMDPSFPRLMPNFSHGTAGIAYFLAQLYGETKDRRFLDAALSGAKYLLSVAKTEGDACLIFHNEPDGKDLYYLGWCHGPVGTARLFYALSEATGDRSWLAWVRKEANALVQAGIPDRESPGFWNNDGICCGLAGVGEFFLDLGLALNDESYRAFAERVAARLLAKATVVDGRMSWLQAEHRVRPDFLVAQTGYMQGAAGIGMFLLRLDEAARGAKRGIIFPDTPFRN